MPFSKIKEDFLRPAPLAAFRIFLIAHIVALILCMVYPIIMCLLEYSDTRLMSDHISNAQNFSNNIIETFGWYIFYSFPAFIVGVGLYLSEIFYAKSEFRKISYVVTLIMMIGTLYLDTDLNILEHPEMYGTGVLYVILLFSFAKFFTKRAAAKK